MARGKFLIRVWKLKREIAYIPSPKLVEWILFSISFYSSTTGFEELVCPSGYDDLWPDSTHCYWIANEQVTWEGAKLKCKEDGAELACFSDQQERDAIADQCDNCWVGYTWQGGKFYLLSVFYGVWAKYIMKTYKLISLCNLIIFHF